MDFFQMSLSGAVLILAVTVVRALFLSHLPKITFHILWMAALIRLLVPFSLSSATSIYTWIPGLGALEETLTASLSEFLSAETGADDAAARQKAGAGTNGSAARQKAGAGTNGAAARQTAGIGADGISGVQGADTTVFVGAEDPMPANGGVEPALAGSRGIGGVLLLLPVCLAVWIAGAAALAFCFLLAYVRAYREFGTSLPVENSTVQEWLAVHPLRRKLEVRYSDRICAPLAYRVFRPVILLPGRADNRESAGTGGYADSLLYILEHEYVHIHRLDALTKILMAAALCLHWFNPFVWMMYILFNRDMELSCDEAVLCRLGGNTKSAYAMTLIRMEERKDSFTPLFSNFSRNAMEERIGAIMKLKKRTPGRLVTACLTIMVICGLFATSAMKQPAQASVEAQSKTAAADEKEAAYAEDAISAAMTALGELNHAVARLEEKIRAAETVLGEPGYTTAGQEEAIRAAETAPGEPGNTVAGQEETVRAADADLESLYKTLSYLQLEQEKMEQLIFFEQEYGSYGIHYDPTGEGTLRMDGRTVGHFADEDNGGELWTANGCELNVTVERDDGEIAYFVVMTEGDAQSSFTVKAVEDAGESETDVQTEAVTVTETVYTDTTGEAPTTAEADVPGGALEAAAEDITEEMPMEGAENAGEEMSATAVEDAVKEMPAGASENTREDVSKDETAVSEMLQAEAAVAAGSYEPSEEDLKREQEYREAGITEDPHTGEWLYDGRVISMMVDEGGGIYMNNMEDTPKEDRLYVIVERGEDGSVKGAKTVTLEDAVLSYVKNRY